MGAKWLNACCGWLFALPTARQITAYTDTPLTTTSTAYHNTQPTLAQTACVLYVIHNFKKTNNNFTNLATIMIETKRLILKPLTYEQLIKYAKCDNSLEAELNLNKSSRTISAELMEAFENTILPNVADKTKNYLYSTLWTAISKAKNEMVGDLCMVGEPNADGEIEIGYGTYDEFQGKGFMTEIVGGIIDWTKTQPLVKSITAFTDKKNAASFKVLQNNNFVKTGETETSFSWKLKIKDH